MDAKQKSFNSIFTIKTLFVCRGLNLFMGFSYNVHVRLAFKWMLVPVLCVPRQQQLLHGNHLAVGEVLTGFEFLKNERISVLDVGAVQHAGHVPQHLHVISAQTDTTYTLDSERNSF